MIIMLLTVHVNSNYVRCPLKINGLGVKDERLLNKTNIVDIVLSLVLRVSNVI